MRKIYVCTYCGSPRVKRDAWVSVNDPDDVSVFDDTFCEDCDGPCRIEPVVVSDDFDELTEFYHETTH